MGRRRDDLDAAAVVICVLIVLAGCNTLGQGGSTTRTDTVTPVPVESPTPSPTPVAWQAPGVEGTSLTDVEALLDAHRSHLSNRSFTLTWSRQATNGSGPIGNTYRREVAVVNATTYRRSAVGSVHPGELEMYVDGDRTYRRVETENGSVQTARTGESVGRPRQFYAVLAVPVVSLVVQPGATDVELVERDGTTYARLVSRAVPDYLVQVYDDYDLTDFGATVWVHPDGYVRSAHYEMTLHGDDDDPVDVDVRYDYTAVGETTVEQPPWVAGLKTDGTETPGTPPGTGTTTPSSTGTVPATEATPTGTVPATDATATGTVPTTDATETPQERTATPPANGTIRPPNERD